MAPTPFAAVKPAPVKKVALSLTDSWPPAAAAADYIDPLIPRNPRQAPKHGVGVWRQQPQYVKVLEPSTTEPRQTFWERAEESNKQVRALATCDWFPQLALVDGIHKRFVLAYSLTPECQGDASASTGHPRGPHAPTARDEGRGSQGRASLIPPQRMLVYVGNATTFDSFI